MTRRRRRRRRHRRRRRRRRQLLAAHVLHGGHVRLRHVERRHLLPLHLRPPLREGAARPQGPAARRRPADAVARRRSGPPTRPGPGTRGVRVTRLAEPGRDHDHQDRAVTRRRDTDGRDPGRHRGPLVCRPARPAGGGGSPHARPRRQRPGLHHTKAGPLGPARRRRAVTRPGVWPSESPVSVTGTPGRGPGAGTVTERYCDRGA